MLSGDEVAELSNFIEHVSRTSMSGKPSELKKYACRNRVKLQRTSFKVRAGCDGLRDGVGNNEKLLHKKTFKPTE